MKYDIYSFYDEVVTRPGLFISEKSLTMMENFLAGAKTALERVRIYEKNDSEYALHGEYVGSEFDRWLLNELEAASFQNACDLIKVKTGSEELALEQFIALYKKYRGDDFGAYTRYMLSLGVTL